MVIFGALLPSCNTGTDFPLGNTYRISDSTFTGVVTFQKLSTTSGFKVLLKKESGEIADYKIFKYKPYRFDTADVNRDGSTEIIVGLIKHVRFDSVSRKRLFILRIDDYHIRPMWMGSKVCQDLVDFKVAGNGMIQTVEKTRSGKYAIGSYYWESFGLTLERYLENEISYDDAIQVLGR